MRLVNDFIHHDRDTMVMPIRRDYHGIHSCMLALHKHVPTLDSERSPALTRPVSAPHMAWRTSRLEDVAINAPFTRQSAAIELMNHDEMLLLGCMWIHQVSMTSSDQDGAKAFCLSGLVARRHVIDAPDRLDA